MTASSEHARKRCTATQFRSPGSRFDYSSSWPVGGGWYTSGMRVKDLAERDRPRERLLTTGHEALADRELLALLIGSGTPGTDAITLAVKVIEACGDLSQLAQAEP